MKAKHFRKLRQTLKYYDVEVTSGLFGRFSGFQKGHYITVLAKNYENACLRACKRGYGRRHWGMFNVTTENWAKFAVKLTEKSAHWRNVAYRGN